MGPRLLNGQASWPVVKKAFLAGQQASLKGAQQPSPMRFGRHYHSLSKGRASVPQNLIVRLTRISQIICRWALFQSAHAPLEAERHAARHDTMEKDS